MAAMAAVRQAQASDVPFIAAMIRELAIFERLEDACIASEEDYAATLFKAPALQGPTVLLLELVSKGSSSSSGNAEPAKAEIQEMLHEVKETIHDVQDPDAPFFSSRNDRKVVGFVLFFPNYSTFLAKPGLYIEDLYVRQPFRRQGLGNILLSTVAHLASTRGYGRVEWCVLDWNLNAINFYKGMGAQVLDEWRICRLTGDALTAYASPRGGC